jgi:hypothetical protein
MLGHHKLVATDRYFRILFTAVRQGLPQWISFLVGRGRLSVVVIINYRSSISRITNKIISFAIKMSPKLGPVYPFTQSTGISYRIKQPENGIDWSRCGQIH